MTTLPPLSTAKKATLRTWTPDEYREHLQRIKDLAQEALDQDIHLNEKLAMSAFGQIAGTALDPMQ